MLCQYGVFAFVSFFADLLQYPYGSDVVLPDQLSDMVPVESSYDFHTVRCFATGTSSLLAYILIVLLSI